MYREKDLHFIWASLNWKSASTDINTVPSWIRDLKSLRQSLSRDKVCVYAAAASEFKRKGHFLLFNRKSSIRMSELVMCSKVFFAMIAQFRNAKLTKTSQRLIVPSGSKAIKVKLPWEPLRSSCNNTAQQWRSVGRSSEWKWQQDNTTVRFYPSHPTLAPSSKEWLWLQINGGVH